MQSARALGSLVELRIVCRSRSQAESIFSMLWSKIEQFQNEFSRFLPESDLTQFNSQAGKKVPISAVFHDLLKKVQYYNVLSHGLYNPFILPAVQAAGYVKSLDRSSLSDAAIIYDKAHVVDGSHLRVGADWAKIPKDTAIDLGGIGKGYLADLCAELLNPHTNNYCLSMGGDIITSGTNNGDSWNVMVASPVNSVDNSANVVCESKMYAVATSGLRRNVSGRLQEHIIDPRTAKLAQCQYEMCTIIAKHAATADVLASCALIGDADFIKTLIKDKIIIGVLLQSKADDSPRIKMYGSGFRLVEDSQRSASRENKSKEVARV